EEAKFVFSIRKIRLVSTRGARPVHNYLSTCPNATSTFDPSYGIRKIFWGSVDVESMVAVKVVRNVAFIGVTHEGYTKSRVLTLLLTQLREYSLRLNRCPNASPRRFLIFVNSKVIRAPD